jgi:hypothetical protein
MSSCKQGRTVASEIWSQSRWLRILERMEYRHTGIGLRFSVPPLWLEVTMSGPDSDAWSTAGDKNAETQSWDWQSAAPCPEAVDLAEAGADDDELLGLIVKYTVENLILNATHEIGEWLRFDGGRLFPAHLRGVDEVQGNGAVRVDVDFDPTPTSGTARTSHAVYPNQSERIGSTVGAWRFTYLPGIQIAYDSSGPLVTSADGASTWAMAWSTPTLDAVHGPPDELTALVAADVHRVLVRYETDLICRSLYVDGQQDWRLDPDGDRRSTNPPDGDGIHSKPLAVTVAYR